MVQHTRLRRNSPKLLVAVQRPCLATKSAEAGQMEVADCAALGHFFISSLLVQQLSQRLHCGQRLLRLLGGPAAVAVAPVQQRG